MYSPPSKDFVKMFFLECRRVYSILVIHGHFLLVLSIDHLHTVAYSHVYLPNLLSHSLASHF